MRVDGDVAGFIRGAEEGAPAAGGDCPPGILTLVDGDGAGEEVMVVHAAETARQAAILNDKQALAGLRAQAEYRKKLAYKSGVGVSIGSIVLIPVDNVKDRHALDPDHLCGVVIRVDPSIRVAVSILGPLKGTFSPDQVRFASAFQNPMLYGAEEVHAHITSLSVDALQSFAKLPTQSVRAEFQRSSHFGDTRNTLGGDVQCSCSAGKQVCKSKSCSCFKNGASCTSKCHGGRGSSTAKCCNTTNLDDPQLLVPGAFASRPCDAGAIDPAARKELLFKAVNSLQGGMEVCVWVVGSDVLNGGPDDWVLGKLTHEAGDPRPFVVNYNDGTVERYTAAPLSEAEDGALRHEVEMGYICATRMPTAAEWGTAAFGPAPVVAAGSKLSKAPKRKPAAPAVRDKPAKAANVNAATAAKPPTTTKAHTAAPAQATSAGV
mmetsp:Transcript_928/g.2981  ORF Transcript_928/g.2981 Transcript_928/m.2981 type:complete len:433 (+) Transcript_928:526-1824(+)